MSDRAGAKHLSAIGRSVIRLPELLADVDVAINRCFESDLKFNHRRAVKRNDVVNAQTANPSASLTPFSTNLKSSRDMVPTRLSRRVALLMVVT